MPLRQDSLEGITASSGDIVATAPNASPSQLSVYRYRRSNKSYTEDLGNGVNLTLMLIPSGEFIMGAPKDEPDSRDRECPQHRVLLPSFFLGRYPVTQVQWRIVAGYDPVERNLDPDPAHFKGNNRPVERVSWDDAQEFCQRLSRKTEKVYRLPTEAQWEYACRAGTTTPFYFGETILPELANYNTEYSYNDTEFRYIDNSTAESQGVTTEVGSFPANDWGLHDMHGNVWEWCEDDYHDTYKDAPVDGSVWVDANREETDRLLRGGFWDEEPQYCRSAARIFNSRDFRNDGIGFRVCCEWPVGLTVAPAGTLPS